MQSGWRMGGGGSIVGIAVSVAIAVAGSGCTPQPDQWASGAQEYVDALHTAHATGFTNVAQFYAEEATVDDQVPDTFRGSGRAVIAQWKRDYWQPDPGAGRNPADTTQQTSDEIPYVSTRGLLDPSWIHADPYVIRGAYDYEVGPAGITSHTWLAARHTADHHLGVFTTAVDPLADAYLAAWGGQDPAAAAALYAPGAVLEDSVLGIRLSGPGPIATAARTPPGQGGLPGATLHEIIDDFGPAVYVHVGGPSGNDVIGLGLLLGVPGEGGCTWAIGARIALDDDGLITREERFHRIDSARTCIGVGSLPSGWWDTVRTPDPQAFTPTGTITMDAGRTTLWNSTPQREKLLRWALQRFTAAALPPLTLTSVTFAAPVADPWTEYGFMPGALDVVLPSTADGCPAEGCDEWPESSRSQALASLSGAWLADRAQEASLAEFSQRHGLSWAGPQSDDSWATWDRAGATIAWGLADWASPIPDALAPSSCAELVAEFLALAQSTPVRPACA